MSYIDKTLGRGENPILTIRRHFVVLLGYAIKWIGLFLVAIIAIIYAAGWHDQGSSDSPNFGTFKTVLVLALFALALVSVLAMLANYVRWYNEVYVLTNRRVIRIQGIFNKDELDSSLDKLNDTKEHQSVWGRIFNYGTVEILTASQEGIDRLDFVPNPMQFRKAIQDAKNGYYNEVDAPQVVNNPNQNRPVTGMVDRAAINSYPQGNQAVRNPNGYQTVAPMNGYQPPMTAPLDNAGTSQIRPNDVPGLIQQLAKLRDAGVITEAEFQAKKNDLFGRM